MNHEQMGGTSERGPSAAARQNAIEHAEEIEARASRMEMWQTRRTEVQDKIAELKNNIETGTETASKQESEGAIDLGIALRNANKREIKNLEIELSELEEKIQGAGGKLEDENSLDFTTSKTIN